MLVQLSKSSLNFDHPTSQNSLKWICAWTQVINVAAKNSRLEINNEYEKKRALGSSASEEMGILSEHFTCRARNRAKARSRPVVSTVAPRCCCAGGMLGWNLTNLVCSHLWSSDTK